jgi:hypothetical protein
LGGGWRRRAGSGGTDGRKIKIPAFYRRHEAALAPQSEQVWVENLSLTTERQPSSARSTFRGCVRRAIAAFAQFVHTVLVVAAGVFASTVAGMLNDGRRLS